jgi:hypothetical protein
MRKAGITAQTALGAITVNGSLAVYSCKPSRTLAWMRQAMRRNRNCLWFERVSSPNISRYFSELPDAHLAQALDLLVDVLGLIFHGVNHPSHEGSLSRGSQLRVGRKGGADRPRRAGRRSPEWRLRAGVAARHERSPCGPPTAISAARSTRCLAGLVNYIRRECGTCPVWGRPIVRPC